jgi:hypothetical protein
MNMIAREIPMMGLQLKHPLLPSPRLNYVLDLSLAQAASAFQLPQPLCPKMKTTLMKNSVVYSLSLSLCAPIVRVKLIKTYQSKKE